MNIGNPNLIHEGEPEPDAPSVDDDEEDDPKNSLLKLQLDVWKTAVHTQMHFNDMSAKARQHGIGLIVIIVGFALFLMSRVNQDYFINLTGIPHHVSYFITLLPPFVLLAVGILDLFVYHPMLRGAVTFGREFEKAIIVPKIMKTNDGMTEMITNHSRSNFGKWQITARRKLVAIYIIAFICLLLIPYFLHDLKPSEVTLKNNTEEVIKYKIDYEKKNSSTGL
ncbi:MAG: hypothetical protein AB7I18_04565 [Candidatus Berkiella sp.]